MIVCFGSINLDLIFPLPHLPVAGQTVLGPSMQIEPGGKGANQAVAAARDGTKVIFAGAVGRDALAEVKLAVQVDGRSYRGQAVSFDVMESSAKAYVRAMNNAAAAKENH